MDNRLFSDHTNVECPKCGCWRWGYIGDECRSEGCDGVMCKKAFTSNECGWLIEWPADDNVPVRWWHPVNGWMRDASKGVRFSRKQDAEAYISAGKFCSPVVATEHAWGFAPETSVPPPGSDIKAIGRWETLVELAAWVDSRIEAEVAHRPDVNIHKRTLADTWGQMQRKLEGMLNQGASAPSSARETYTNEAPSHPPILPERFNSVSLPEKASGEPIYECCNESCLWRGLESETVHPKHEPSRFLCPECHEVVELV